MRGFLAGNASPLTEYTPPPTDKLNAAGYGFYASGIMEKLAATPYDEMIAGDIVWVGTPDDVVERIRETIGRLRGADRDRDHRQPGRRRPLEGDQGAGALRAARHPARAGADEG